MKKENENSKKKNNGKQEEGKGEDGLYSMTNKNANQGNKMNDKINI